MIAGWMLRTLLASAGIALAAWAADRALAAAGRPRRWAWAGGLAGILGIPALSAAAPGLLPGLSGLSGPPGLRGLANLPGLGAIREAGLAVTGRLAALLGGAGAASEGVPGGLPSGAGPTVPNLLPGAGASLDPDPLLTALWAVGSIAVGALFLWSGRRVGRARAEGEPGIAAGEPVRLTRSLGPAVAGVWRPEIVLPRHLLSLRPAELRLVVAHEREHLAAGDTRLLAGAAACLALLPWNPAVWWLARRLRDAVETDCDARVLSAGVDPVAYGRVLLRTAAERGTAPIPIAALSRPVRGLERRIRTMTEHRRRGSFVSAAAFGALALGAVALACDVAEVPTAVESEAPEATASFEERAVGSVLGAREISEDDDLIPDRGELLPDQLLFDAPPVPAADAADRRRIVEEAVGFLRPLESEATPVPAESPSVIRKVAREGAAGTLRATLIPEDRRAALERRLSVGLRAVGAVDGREESRGPAPLFLIDGERASARALRELDPNAIDRIEVVRPPASVSLYGADAEGGAVSITRKR